MSVDPPAKTRALRQRLGLDFDLYRDPTFSASRAWGVFDDDNDIPLASTFVIARGGRVVFRYVGANKSDRPAVDDVLASLRK